MAAFRILNAFPVYLGRDNRPADGGELRFYESGTTTPKSVYADPGLTIDNGSTVGIGSDGRTDVDVWGDGSYRVRLYESDDTLIAEADDVEVPGGDAQSIPALVDGWFLTNNGALLLWEDIRNLLLPDPTGQDGKQLVADGDSALWQSIPEPEPPPDPDIVVEDNSLQVGIADEPEKSFIQRGSGSSPATGQNTSSTAVTFGTAFDSTPTIVVTPTVASAGGGGFLPTPSVISASATGFTVKFDTNGGTSGNSAITSPVTFGYIAMGLVTP